ncbi:hypothetical protein [Microbispora sp. NPDC049125]|uniref:hypothetical protein n=1 Tax=Microbispora sp. NPDC049125 TaxID=3154929 RepID=UPI003465FD42
MTAERPTGVAYEQALAARRGRADPPESAQSGAHQSGVREDGEDPQGGTGAGAQPYDPLRLCVYATVALLTWLLGAWAVLGFAALGLAGYWRARRAGLTKSKCLLRDTRLVLAYLSVLIVVAIAALTWGYLPH